MQFICNLAIVIFDFNYNTQNYYFVPYKKPKIEKIIFSIGEVAEMIGVNSSLIRYLEKEFSIIKPQKNKKGNRLFTKDDIKTIKLIHYLVKERGMTLNGAKQKLKENSDETIHNYEIVKRLQSIRDELIGIRDEMDD